MASHWPRRCAASSGSAKYRSSRCRPSSSPESIERGRKVGFHDYVAKFDRQSLIAALKEQTADVIQAA